MAKKDFEALANAEFGNSEEEATKSILTTAKNQTDGFNFTKKTKPPKIEKKTFCLNLPVEKYEKIREIAGKDNMTEFILKAIDYALSNMA